MHKIIEQTQLMDDHQEDFVGFFSFVMDQFDQDIRLPDLASAASTSPWALCRQFQKQFGTTPMRWIWRFRTMLAAECIQLAPRWQLTDISVLCGFSSLAHFSRQFRNQLGQSPSQFRREVLRSNLKPNSLRSGLLFEDLTTDHRDLLKSVLKRSLNLPQKAG